jgi:hypothetical protein
MSKDSRSGVTVGLDLGDRFSEGRVLNEAGEVIEAFRVRTTEAALSARLAALPPSRVVLEVGAHSPWASRAAARAGHEVIVANPRRVRLIAENDSKIDGVDAEPLARLGRVDCSLLKPICPATGSFPRQGDRIFSASSGVWFLDLHPFEVLRPSGTRD